MMQYPVAGIWTGARVRRIYEGTHEITKEIIGRAS
jgi:alkylation response protein AidB-like acyl-CoA dehydrogenase